MTWCERPGPGAGEVSLRDLFAGATPAARLAPATTYPAVLAELARPGFPALAQRRSAFAHRLLRAYLDDVARTDVPKLIDMRHDPIVVRRLIDALARRVSSAVSYARLAADLADPALAMAAMGVDATRLQADPATAGRLFASAVVHDLLVLTAALEGDVRHYRDSNGYEIDAVVTGTGGTYVMSDGTITCPLAALRP